jgi:hypothetical protein
MQRAMQHDMQQQHFGAAPYACLSPAHRSARGPPSIALAPKTALAYFELSARDEERSTFTTPRLTFIATACSFLSPSQYYYCATSALTRTRSAPAPQDPKERATLTTALFEAHCSPSSLHSAPCDSEAYLQPDFPSLVRFTRSLLVEPFRRFFATRNFLVLVRRWSWTPF